MRERYQHDLQALEKQLLDLGHEVQQAVHKALWAFDHDSQGFAQQVVANDNAIDDLRYSVEQAALSLIARQQPLARDLRTVSTLLSLASELERIGDYAEGIATLVLRMQTYPSFVVPAELGVMAHDAEAMLVEALQALQQRDEHAVTRLEAADNLVDEQYRRLTNWAFTSIREHPDSVERITYYLWVAHNLERIADRTVNIGERTNFITTGLLDPPR